MDKNNLPLILKSLPFVSHRPAPHNGTLCENFLRGPARPHVLLPANRGRQEGGLELGSGRDSGQARRCCWTPFRDLHAAGRWWGLARKANEQGAVENAGSRSWPEQLWPFHARSQPLCPPAAARACRPTAGREASALRAQAKRRRVGSRHSCLFGLTLQSPCTEC